MHVVFIVDENALSGKRRRRGREGCVVRSKEDANTVLDFDWMVKQSDWKRA